MASSSHPASVSSRKYPYPIDVKVRDFVPINLSNGNYFVWKMLMLRLIESEGLDCFIKNDVVSAPPERITLTDENNDSSTATTKEMENQDYADWKRSDALLQRWIIATLCEDVLRNVVCLKTAKDMWSQLVTLHETEIDYPYPFPKEINVRDFVSIKLSSKHNYPGWKTLMLGLIESQGLVGFINGEFSEPQSDEVPKQPSSSDDDFVDDNNNNTWKSWEKSDGLLRNWIMETIDYNVSRHVLPLHTAKDIWLKLSILYGTNYAAYPNPMEVNVGDFVPFKLSSSNYLTWRRLMLDLFENQSLLGFILPQDKNMILPSSDSLAWKKTDKLLQSWIIRTINENFLAYVVDLETATDMWSKLESIFTSEGSFAETILDYPYPIEVNVGDFVPIKLSKENVSLWAKLMFRLIDSQGLACFIYGEVPAPPQRITIADDNSSTNPEKEVENPDYKAWKRTDDLLQSWIMGTINENDVLTCLVDLETAQDIWTKLLKFFDFDTPYESTETDDETEDPISEYLPLYKAALTGDWEKAKEFIKRKPDAVRTFITGVNETALMIAVRSARGNHFVKNILEHMLEDDLALADENGWTALHYAAMAGNTEGAKYLVDKNTLLPNCCCKQDFSPLLKATTFGRNEMIDYLLVVTKEDIAPKVFEDINGAIIIKNLILGGLYDIALLLIQRYPKLAWVQSTAALEILANCSSAFKSGAHLNWWQSLIYSYVPMKLEAAQNCCGGDIENPLSIRFLSVKQKLQYIIWKFSLIWVPKIKYIQEIKLKHEQARELLKHLCNKSLELNFSKVKQIIQHSLVYAANSGIPEVVEEIIQVYPGLVYHTNEMGQNILHIAILNRCEDIFNLIYQFREEVRHLILTCEDSNGKSCLDLVVELKKEQKLDLRASAAGAALQMQRELQWFKEVEKHAIDYYKESRSKETTTSGPVYTETHEDLVKEGESWMKDTATSCTIIAALVATVVFAAAITVPGGNNSNTGIPILFQETAFIIFVTSDALGLFSSISSVVMFSSILTSRYSVTDFLFTLPNRLIIGLITLFISLISMMVAFGGTLYLMFGHQITWILFPVTAFSFIPIALFAYSQFPLLLDMMKSTYGPGMFRQQSDRILF